MVLPRRLVLSDYGTDSVLGGYPCTSTWPTRARKKLTPLVTLGPELLARAGVAIPASKRLTVFVDVQASTKLVLDGSPSPKALASVPVSIVLQERASRPIVDHKAPVLPWPAPCGLHAGDPLDDAVEGDRSTLCISKLGGRPGWLQDPVELPGLTFVLQLSAQTLLMAGAHTDPLRGGLGYLFLDRKAPGEGVFFAQAT